MSLPGLSFPPPPQARPPPSQSTNTPPSTNPYDLPPTSDPPAKLDMATILVYGIGIAGAAFVVRPLHPFPPSYISLVPS